MKFCDQCRSTYPNEFNVCPIDNTPLRIAAEIFPGITIRDKYLILDKIGEGGMGAVYRARHLAFNEIRALKVVHSAYMEDRAFIKRFKTEAIVARKLQHPNAVRVDDLDTTEDGRPFIVMEMVEGGNLKTLIAQVGVFPVPRAVSITIQTAEALAAAHKLGIVHRDIKPDNILVARAPDGSDLVKVADFGIAKVHEGAIDVGSGYTNTRSGIIVGTPQYLSPEQATGMRGEQIDGRADIYSLGIVLYMMLTGQLPFDSDTPMGFLMHHVQTKPVAPHEVRPDLKIPPALSALLMKALEKDRDKRFASADEMASALRHLQPATPTVAYAPREPSAVFDSALQDFRYRGAPAPPQAPAHPAPAPAPPRPQPSDAPLGSRRLEEPLPVGQKRSGVKAAIWVAACVVVLGAIFAVMYASGVFSGSKPGSASPGAASGTSTPPAQTTASPAATPVGTSETPAPKPVEGAPGAKPPAASVAGPAPESTTPTERTVKKQPPPAKAVSVPAPEPPKKTKGGGVDVEALINAGNQAWENGEYGKAINTFEKAVQADPSNARAQAGLSKAKQAQKTEEQLPH